jgi:hypothetical protein
MAAFNTKRMLARKVERNLKIYAVGFGFCGECDERHEPDPNPFAYTVGLTEASWPELVVIMPLTGADAIVAEMEKIAPEAPNRSMATEALAIRAQRLLSDLANLQLHRGKAFTDGEHIHRHEFGHDHGCCVLRAGMPSVFFPLGAATQRYGKAGYRVMQVLLHDHAGRLQDDPQCAIYATLHPASP